MKRIILLFYLGLTVLNIYGQKKKILEPAILECHYKHIALKDTVKQIPYSEDLIILRIGNTMSQVFSYHTFYGDSLLTTPEGRKLAGQLTLEGVKTRNYDMIPGVRTMREYIHKNYPTGKITVLSTVDALNEVVFEENYEPQPWLLQDSTKTIMDYNCQLAECDFRGRKYYAWFTPEIPISEGPWKFNGLPGLIMEVYDQEKHYHFEITGILKEQLVPVTYYTRTNKKATKTTRVKYLSALKKFEDNMVQSIKASSGIDLNPDNEPREKHLFYDFMEKDY